MRHRIFGLLLGMILLQGCSDGLKSVESDFIIKVSGSSPIEFNGHYTIAGTGKIPKPIPVSGTTPMEFKGKGIAAACVIRKKAAGGILKVAILNGPKVVSSSEVETPYGIITLGKIPDAEAIINRIIGIVLGSAAADSLQRRFV